jgi:membrane protein
MSVRRRILRGLSGLHLAGRIVWQAIVGWFDHDASTMGASLAFFTLFSIAPILIIAVGILRLLIGKETIQAELLEQMRILFGEPGASAVEALLLSATHARTSRLATIVGVTSLVLGASSVFVELQLSMDRIWGVPPRTRMGSFWHVVRARFMSLGLVIGVGFVLMVSLLVSTVIAALDAWLASSLGQWGVTLLIVDMILSVAITSVLFALVYKYIPQVSIAWKDIWVGSVVAALLFNAGKAAIGFYLGRGALSSVYGAAGSLLVLLLWSYYSAQIFLFGAEMTKACAQVAGTRRAERA